MKRIIVWILLNTIVLSTSFSQSSKGFDNWLKWSNLEKEMYVNRILHSGDQYSRLLMSMEYYDAASQLRIVLNKRNRTELVIQKIDEFFLKVAPTTRDYAVIVSLEENVLRYVFLKIIKEEKP